MTQLMSITRMSSIRFRISRTYKDTHTQHTHTQQTHTTHTHIHNDPVDDRNQIVVNKIQNLAHLQRERERERDTHTHTCACEIPWVICVGCDILLGLVCVGLGVCGINLCGFWLSIKMSESCAPLDRNTHTHTHTHTHADILCVMVLCDCQGNSKSRTPTKTHTHEHTQHTHIHKNTCIFQSSQSCSRYILLPQKLAHLTKTCTHTHTHT